MKKQNIGFTLIELIITITILAILWLIAFLNYKDYSRDSRNSVRLNDVSNIKKVLELFYLNSNFYPDPDNTTDVTYSWWLLWKQWTFSDGMITRLDRFSKVPKDPLIDVDYSYSLFNKKTKYQLALMLEGKSTISFFPQTYAYTNENVVAFVTGNYDLYDVTSFTWADCYTISSPSMIINNLPINGELQTSTNYNFVYNDSRLLPKNYEERMDMVNPGFWFNVFSVYNKCDALSLSDINTYIVNLSSAYSQFNAVPLFNEVANKARTLEFIKKSLWYLTSNGITVAKDIVAAIENAFIDTFVGNNNDILVWGHVSDTIWEWEFIGTPVNAGSYIINNNMLEKALTNGDIVTPKLLKPKTNADSTSFVKVVNFNGWAITLYSRYIDDDNYYAVTLSPTGYTVFKKVWWVVINLAPVNSTLLDGSVVQFEVVKNSSNTNWVDIKLIINGNELVNNADNVNTITAIWKELLKLDTAWMVVDDYTLYFN